MAKKLSMGLSGEHKHLAVVAIVAVVAVVVMVLNAGGGQKLITGEAVKATRGLHCEDVGDDGYQPGVKGRMSSWSFISDKYVENEDRCLTNTELSEYWCDGIEPRQSTVDCSRWGKSCRNGACV